MIKWAINDEETVFVSDWDEALTVSAKLDRLEPGESRRLIQGKSALLILAEYGLVFYRCAHPGEGIIVPLLIVIDIEGKTVYVSFSACHDMKVFIGKHDPKIHGEWVKKLEKESLWGFSNIEARVDGWAFFADILGQSWLRKKTID